MLLLAIILSAHILTVGPGRRYERIEAAVAAAAPGDTIEVYPRPGGYKQTAVRITTPGLTIKGVAKPPVLVDGTGFDYSGVGKVPRAIFQIDPTAEGVTIRHFELEGAHNKSFNGAGVRINGANHMRISHCDIHGNDMGIMSAENGDLRSAAAQLIDECHVHHNGAIGDPGFNHNLYLGGYGVTLLHCEIDHSITGHNLKSRAFATIVFDCYIHDAANREADLVESAETEHDSEACFENCVIAKDPACSGNRVLIQFGRERGRRLGALLIEDCTLITEFTSPAIQLTDPGATAEMDNSIVLNTQQSRPTLFQSPNKAADLTGKMNWLSYGYKVTGTNLNLESTFRGSSLSDDLGIGPPSFSASKPPANLVPTRVTLSHHDPVGIGLGLPKQVGAYWKPLDLNG